MICHICRPSWWSECRLWSLGTRVGKRVVQVNILKSKYRPWMISWRFYLQEGKGALTPVSGVMSGTYSPYQGPPQGPGGYPAPPNPGARYLVYFCYAVLCCYPFIKEEKMRLSWKRPYLQVPHLHPWTTKRSQSSSKPWAKASQCRWLIDCWEYIFVQHESLEPGGSSQQYQMHLFNLIHPFSRWWSPTVPDASRDAPAAAAAANSLHLPCASGLALPCTITIIFKAKKLHLHIWPVLCVLVLITR